MISKRLLFTTIVFTFFITLPLLSQSVPETENTPGVKVDFMGLFAQNLTETEGKLLKLVEAMPDDKLTWRPSEGVRSVSEVALHVAAGNYFIMSFFGHAMPEGINREFEKSSTSKSVILDEIKKGFAYSRERLASVTEDQLAKSYDFFGNQVTGSWIVLLLVNHPHEHLGQMIAYARANNITPPWSEG